MKIAVTGGIGSGKSALCSAFKQLGYPCFSCDEIYKEVFAEEDYIAALVSIFGEKILSGGKPDRKKISSEVFSDKNKLELLNKEAHPRIMRRLYKAMEGYPLCFAEVPLLFEGGYEKDFDRVIIVYRNKESRILSVMARDGATKRQAEDRMAAQIDAEKLISLGYCVIYNDGDLSALKEKAKKFIEEL